LGGLSKGSRSVPTKCTLARGSKAACPTPNGSTGNPIKMGAVLCVHSVCVSQHFSCPCSAGVCVGWGIAAQSGCVAALWHALCTIVACPNWGCACTSALVNTGANSTQRQANTPRQNLRGAVVACIYPSPPVSMLLRVNETACLYTRWGHIRKVFLRGNSWGRNGVSGW